MTDRLDNYQYSRSHEPLRTCQCAECQEDRQNDCQNPQRCAMEAQKWLDKITQMFNPTHDIEYDNLSLTKQRKQANEQARMNDSAITFDPSITVKTNLGHCFRILMDKKTLTVMTVDWQQLVRGISLQEEELTVYTDRSCILNGKTEA